MALLPVLVFSLIDKAVTRMVIMAITPKTAPVALQACCKFNPLPWIDPGQDGSQCSSQDVTENAEDHPDGSQAGAFIVIVGQFGCEGRVGGVGHGVGYLPARSSIALPEKQARQSDP